MKRTQEEANKTLEKVYEITKSDILSNINLIFEQTKIQTKNQKVQENSINFGKNKIQPMKVKLKIIYGKTQDEVNTTLKKFRAN